MMESFKEIHTLRTRNGYAVIFLLVLISLIVLIVSNDFWITLRTILHFGIPISLIVIFFRYELELTPKGFKQSFPPFFRDKMLDFKTITEISVKNLKPKTGWDLVEYHVNSRGISLTGKHSIEVTQNNGKKYGIPIKDRKAFINCLLQIKPDHIKIVGDNWLKESNNNDSE